MTKNLPDIFKDDEWVSNMVSEEYRHGNNYKPDELAGDKLWVGMIYGSKIELQNAMRH